MLIGRIAHRKISPHPEQAEAYERGVHYAAIFPICSGGVAADARNFSQLVVGTCGGVSAGFDSVRAAAYEVVWPRRCAPGGKRQCGSDQCHARGGSAGRNSDAGAGRGQRQRGGVAGGACLGRGRGVDGGSGSGGASRTLLPGVAAFSRRQRSGDCRGNVSDAFTAGAAGFGTPLPHRRGVHALRFSGLHRRCCGNAAADLFFVGAASCATADRYVRSVCRGDAGGLQTRREYPAAGGGTRVAVFVWQDQRERMKRIAILGGGSWGTALALVLSRSRENHQVSLWVHDAELAVEIARTRENKKHLTGFQLPEQICVTPEIAIVL